MIRPFLRSVLIFSMLGLAGCAQSPSPAVGKQASPVIARAGSTTGTHVARGFRSDDTSRRVAVHEDGTRDEAPMPLGRHGDPDPAIRLHALEAWAFHPGPTLDPVTYALVDPDESVRARAQEVFEEALARW